MFKRHTTAICLALALVGAEPVQAQDLNLTPEELQAFFTANQGLSPEELTAKLRELNDKSLDAARERAKTGYSSSNPPELAMRKTRVGSKSTPAAPQKLTLGQGIITAVSFVDDQFRPLPISSVVHDPNLFSVNGDGCMGDKGRGGSGQSFGNTLNIFPCQFWANGTINVMVKGGAQPVIFSVNAGSNDTRPMVDAMLTVEYDDGGAGAFPDLASRRLTINPLDRKTGGVTPIYPDLGVITDIAFIDTSGNPWPIEEVVYQASMVSIGGSTCADESQQGGSSSAGTGNVLYLSLCRDRSSNISVKLQGAPAALGLLLVSPGADQSAMKRDVTISVTVPGRSPTAVENATAAASALPGSDVDRTGFQPDRFLADFVNGTPPRGARFVQLLGASNIEAYIYNGQLYVRGRYRPINPTADASATSSSGGVNVWRYNKPVNSMIVADALNGQEFSLTADY